MSFSEWNNKTIQMNSSWTIESNYPSLLGKWMVKWWILGSVAYPPISIHVQALPRKENSRLAQTWWDKKEEKTTFVIEIGDNKESSTSQPIKTWARLFKALRNHFYPPRYVQSLWIKWHQLRQLRSQGVQGYIDFSCKMCLLLHVPDLEEVLILKFVVGLLIQFHREVELFENATLDKTFQRSLAIERRVSPRGCIPQSCPYTNPPAS